MSVTGVVSGDRRYVLLAPFPNFTDIIAVDTFNTVSGGTQFAMSTMPGEHVDHVFAGQMGPETIHFLEAVLMDRPVMVTPEHARMVMETYSAADISADRNEPVTLPLSNSALSDLAQIKAAQ